MSKIRPGFRGFAAGNPGPPSRRDASNSSARTALPQPSSIHGAEFQHPTADALVGEVEPLLRKQLLDVAIAQREAQVEPHRVLDQGRRETMPAIGDRKHPRAYGRSALRPNYPDSAAKAACRDWSASG